MPISIQQGYSIIINDNILPLDKYRVYKKLAVQGYKISIEIKQLCDTDEPQSKRIKLSNEDCTIPSTSNAPEESLQTYKSIKEINKELLKESKYKISSPRKKDVYNVNIL